MLKNYYITTCGRIFIKDSYIRSTSSLGDKPTSRSTFLRYIRRNNMDELDFDIIQTNERNSSGKKLFLFKYKKWTPLYKELFGCVCNQGYRVVSIGNKTMKWHRVVLMALKPIDNTEMYQVNHIDGNKLNNSVLNLEWCDSKHNIRHAWSNGLSKRTDELNNRARDTIISKTPTEKVFDENYKGQKPNIKLFLKSRGLKFEDYEYIITARTKSGHALGYLKTK